MVLQQQLDRVVAEEGVPGIIAEVRTEDGDTWFGAAGVGDIETKKPRRREEHFRIGSATKTFTSTITLQLAAEGRLSLDDSVEKWLPGLVRGHGNDGSAITIRQLLAMTDGLYLYSMEPELVAAETGPAFLEHRYERYRPEDLARVALSHPPACAPGTGWRYNNTGYILAGMIVERVTGHSFADELQQRIAQPLDLKDTYLPGDETTIREPHARNYTTALLTEPGSPVYDATELHPSKAWTAGGMVSSLGDLNRFFGLLFGGRLLPPEQQQELLTTTSTEGAGWLPNTRYGLGIYTETLPSGITVWGNGGAITGTWTLSLGTKDGRHRLTANLNGDWGNLLGAFTQLAETAFGR
ncbi:D-alanyl-D-alanine carboxypeptidase [Lipingzhangella halophila]|uniref:D-alanyl-D-alanine carboxypeptidase n=1 Tax=Lipingzhangella halophila TaxID=1783352 RepID=A0A7W7W662_9ACTN|nr:serine hydrolase domain-containing protein [Lipingzhangella halophila]MBB4935488.1 D-alanyl-D-alanine carboxypeptidase [Lipingzhangella halophila]